MAAILIFACCLRSSIFRLDASETDERIYIALVQQWNNGAGYTLRGHPVMQILDRKIYDGAIFFHPPLGVIVYWISAKYWALRGVQAVQLFCFVLYYTCLLSISNLLLPKLPKPLFVAVALLCALTPIYAHTNMKIWIDNPRIAFFSLHLLLLFLALKKDRLDFWVLAVVSSVLPVLTKVDSIMAYPFAYWLALSAQRVKSSRRNRTILTSIFLLNLGIALGWFIYAQGTSHGIGRPGPELQRGNFFLWYVTSKLSSARFIGEYFLIVASVVPSILIVALQALASKARLFPPSAELQKRLALVFWIGGLCIFYAFLGALGYSKVHRYLIMTVPAANLLFAFALYDLTQLWERHRDFASGRRLLWAPIFLLGVGFNLEIAQGLNEIIYYPKFAIIFPILTGVPDPDAILKSE